MRTWYGPRHWWRSARPLAGAAVAAGVALWWLVRPPAAQWSDLPERAAIRALPASERVAHGVDLAHVHSELLPRLWLAYQRLPEREPYRGAAFDALYAALEPVPAWADLAIAWRDALEAPVQDRGELRRIEARWNAAMRDASMPWTVRTPLDREVARFGHIALSYHVEGDAKALTEVGPVRVVYGRRADRLNIREGYFGWSNPETNEAFVALDRVEAFARVELWPLMSDDAARVDPRLSDMLRTRVRGEVASALPVRARATIRASAPARARQLRVVQGIADRAACGAAPPVTAMAARSWDRRSLRALSAHLAPVDADCPAVTSVEIARLDRAQRRLDRVVDLDVGVAELTYVAAGVVAEHEIQHLVDAATGELDGRCDVEHEVSAYLGAIERSAAPAVALLMACRVAQAGPPELRDAVSVALSGVDPTGCAGAPPQELAARAALARQALLAP